ncbi:MAG: hypothetical protein KJ941_07000, partial [Bacteroidetes bacterium]|nr:hypothetical protein [Bacteroidota bacterium]
PKSVADWTVLEATPEFKIEMRTQYCERLEDDLDKTELILKITNLTKVELNLMWDFDYYYNNECVNCGKQNTEFQSSLHLDPLETKEGQCEDTDRTLRHFVKFENIETKVLTDFKISNIRSKNPLDINKTK